MPVPLLDLKAQLESIRHEVLSAVLEVVESQRFILGPPVQRFEEEIAAYTGAAFGIGCASGTDALLLSLATLNLQPGDEVITSPFTFFASAGAIVNAGGRPVFVDIEADTMNIDVTHLDAAITKKTRAIVPVHLFGQMAEMHEIRQVAAEGGIVVIEDAAQALGARQLVDGHWRQAGSIGAMGAFSFFPTKNLGAWGDGGMIVTDDERIAERLRKLRTHGGAKQYLHEEVGTNSRLDAVQAAVLSAKLPHLDSWADARRRHASIYTQAFSEAAQVRAPVPRDGSAHIYNQYTVRAERRDELRRWMAAKEIGTAVYYPRPLHLQPCFAELGYSEGRFPVAEEACRQVLSLPVYPELTAEQQGEVIDAILEFYV